MPAVRTSFAGRKVRSVCRLPAFFVGPGGHEARSSKVPLQATPHNRGRRWRASQPSLTLGPGTNCCVRNPRRPRIELNRRQFGDGVIDYTEVNGTSLSTPERLALFKCARVLVLTAVREVRKTSVFRLQKSVFVLQLMLKTIPIVVRVQTRVCHGFSVFGFERMRKRYGFGLVGVRTCSTRLTLQLCESHLLWLFGCRC